MRSLNYCPILDQRAVSRSHHRDPAAYYDHSIGVGISYTLVV